LIQRVYRRDVRVPDCEQWRLIRRRPGLTTAPVDVLSGRHRLVPMELIMSHHQILTPVQEQSTGVRSCWMCGINLSADHMVADGGSACADVRWYCVDTRACTERWTSRPAGPAGIQAGAAGSAPALGAQPTGPGFSLPTPV
jgi:hypothetical protein